MPCHEPVRSTFSGGACRLPVGRYPPEFTSSRPSCLCRRGTCPVAIDMPRCTPPHAVGSSPSNGCRWEDTRRQRKHVGELRDHLSVRRYVEIVAKQAALQSSGGHTLLVIVVIPSRRMSPHSGSSPDPVEPLLLMWKARALQSFCTTQAEALRFCTIQSSSPIFIYISTIGASDREGRLTLCTLVSLGASDRG